MSTGKKNQVNTTLHRGKQQTKRSGVKLLLDPKGEKKKVYFKGSFIVPFLASFSYHPSYRGHFACNSEVQLDEQMNISQTDCYTAIFFLHTI